MKKETEKIQAIGTCEICKKENVDLYRTHFYYNFKCMCHSPYHFVVIDHCSECNPEEPTVQHICFSKGQIEKMEEYYEKKNSTNN
jgi:hypothetical protein